MPRPKKNKTKQFLKRSVICATATQTNSCTQVSPDPSQAERVGGGGDTKSLHMFYASKWNCQLPKELYLILLPDVHRPSFVSILLHRQDDWQSNKRVMLLHVITARHLHWTLREIWQPWHGGHLLCQINTSPRIYNVAATMPLSVHWISKCFQVDCRLREKKSGNCIILFLISLSLLFCV